ncbi:MAG: L,D-transpeptidase family protein [Micavibrio sp.]
MRPAFLPRLAKPLLITVATLAIGFGVSSHASAQKGNYIGEIGQNSSNFFSFNFGGNDGPIIMASMRGAMEAGQIDALEFRDTAAMVSFYSQREGRTLWIDPRGNSHRKAAAVLHVLDSAWTHGLNPDDYHVTEIASLLAASKPGEKAQLELLVSDAIIRYGHDMTGLRLPANAIRQDPQFWRKPIEAYDALKTISDSEEIHTSLDRFVPHDALYHRLRQELMALAESPDRAFEEHLPISFSGAVLRPGDMHKGVIKLRARMGLAHDPAYGPERKYDDNLAAAVMDFQHRSGLTADGVIGPKTLSVLNRTTREKMDQIVANMERLRWLEAEKPDRYILVNIPSATLWAVEDGKVALEMPVIVGRPERATKSFVTEISGIRFNPKWTVPPTIKSQDFLPKLIEDPTYLQNKGIEVSTLIEGKRYTLDSTAIDWAAVTKQDLRSLRMVQGAGDNNALGRVRVLMENPYDIYLHDTNSPEYFKKTDRTLSSGCIRLSDPEAVAKFILKGNEGWSDKRMNNIIASGRTSEINAADKIPVYILYQTIWQGEDGQLVYGPDVYKQDQRLIEAMNMLKAYHIPAAPAVKYASMGPNLPMP